MTATELIPMIDTAHELINGMVLALLVKTLENRFPRDPDGRPDSPIGGTSKTPLPRPCQVRPMGP